MRALFDLNVVLDLVLNREPWVADAKPLLERVLADQREGYIAATSVTTLHYIAEKNVGARQALIAVLLCLYTFEVAPVDRTVLIAAAGNEGPDFEDDVQSSAAQMSRCDVVVSRDANGFAKSSVRVVTPAALMAELEKGRI